MYKTYLKRTVDIVFAIFLLILSSWLFLLIGFLYWITFQRTVLFRQSRIGKNEVEFVLVKFRTLKEDRNLPVAERRFWLGNVLRFTSFDELPQLIHVLRGDMSLVGPRPLPTKYLPRFNAFQRKRHEVRPGITGWAQVNGRHSISWEEKFQYDVEYIERCSFFFDLQILIRTVLILLSFRRDVSLDEDEFIGK